MSWETTQFAWDKFLDEARAARASVGATYAGAWFRGQTHDWPLFPSLFRATARIAASIEKYETSRRAIRQRLKGARRFARRNAPAPDAKDEKLEGIEAELEFTENMITKLCSKLPDPKTGVVHGEGRAYIEYRFRSGVYHQSSWQTLAEMQHYGVPTRLLDWTESFSFALAFALEDYVQILEREWTVERSKFVSGGRQRRLECHAITAPLMDNTPKVPTLWILNPYRMASVATGEPILWDMTARPADDYFANFVARDESLKPHRFEKPVPILTPWRDERIAAQQGVFTCHGSIPKPAENLFSPNILRSVKLTPEAAVHGVRFLYEFGGLDAYTMFRDKDSLGKKTKKEFFYDHSLL
jgi:hypothetical protein